MPDDYSGVFADYLEREQQQKSAAKAALLTFVDQLRTARVSEVSAQFNGYGDEGSIEWIEFFDSNGKPIAVKDQFPKIEEHFDALLPAGFEQEDGSSGTVTLDVERGSITVDVHWNVTTTENEHYEV